MCAKKTDAQGPKKEDKATAAPTDSVETTVSEIADLDKSAEPKKADAEPDDAVLELTEPVDAGDEPAEADEAQAEGADADPVADEPEVLTGEIVEPEEPTSDRATETVEDAEIADAPEPDVADVVPEPQEKIVERVVEKRGGFVPALFGGVLAGLLGFAAGASDVLAPYLPAGLQRTANDSALSEDIAALQDQIAALEAREPVLPEPPDLSGIEAQIQSGLATQSEAIAAIETAMIGRLDGLEARLDELAQAPVEAAVSEEAIAAYERELAAVQAALAEQRAEVETMIADAARMEAQANDAARLAQARAAATQLFAALDQGVGFGEQVSDIQETGIDVPEALVASSDGIVSLSALQSDFPVLARRALAAARDAQSGSEGVAGFLQRQLGARSVIPRDGDDPDAVLSRAEAALSQADLSGALTELATLPEPAQTVLADWMAQAQTRVDALQGAGELSQTLQAN